MFVSTLYPPRVIGGAELSTHALAKGFAARGHAVSVFTLKEEGDVEEAVEDGIRVLRVRAEVPYWPFDQKPHSIPAKIAYHLWDNYNLSASRRLRAFMAEIRPAIVSTQALTGISAAAWSVARDAGARTVHSIRDYNIMCPRSTYFRKGAVCQSQCGGCAAMTMGRKLLGRAVDGVIANSDYVRQVHQQAGYFPNAAWDVVAPTIDPQTIGAWVEPHDGPVRFGFAGRISHEKGPEWLIDALNRLDHDRWRCTIAGRGDVDYVTGLKAKAPPQVDFAGWMASADFYSNIDVLIAPSIWAEPAGRIIAEAYAHGIPVIAARTGGMTESIEEGVTGWLVDPGSVEQLAAALTHAADPRARAAMDRMRMAALLGDRTTQAAVERYSVMFDHVLGAR